MKCELEKVLLLRERKKHEREGEREGKWLVETLALAPASWQLRFFSRSLPNVLWQKWKSNDRRWKLPFRLYIMQDDLKLSSNFPSQQFSDFFIEKSSLNFDAKFFVFALSRVWNHKNFTVYSNFPFTVFTFSTDYWTISIIMWLNELRLMGRLTRWRTS